MKQYALGLYEKALPEWLSWEEKLAAAGEEGFDFLEISIDETDRKLSRLNWTQNERAALCSAMAHTGVPVRSMCLSGHRKYPLGSSDSRLAARGLDIMRLAVQFAADTGIRMIQLAGYDVYYEPSTPETARRFEENLAIAAEYAAVHGILLGFETMETPFMDTVEKAMRYVELIDSPYLHVYPDIGNLTNAAYLYGTDAAEDLQKGKGRLAAIHIKETLPGRYREVPFGTGHVDLPTMLGVAWSVGVRRYGAELWYAQGQDWRGGISHIAARVSGILNSLAGHNCISEQR